MTPAYRRRFSLRVLLAEHCGAGLLRGVETVRLRTGTASDFSQLEVVRNAPLNEAVICLTERSVRPIYSSNHGARHSGFEVCQTTARRLNRPRFHSRMNPHGNAGNCFIEPSRTPSSRTTKRFSIRRKASGMPRIPPRCCPSSDSTDRWNASPSYSTTSTISWPP